MFRLQNYYFLIDQRKKKLHFASLYTLQYQFKRFLILTAYKMQSYTSNNITNRKMKRNAR